MKKKYIQPTVEVATIRINTNVLQGSIPQVKTEGLGEKPLLYDDEDGDPIDAM
jgi:hypothetical protein